MFKKVFKNVKHRKISFLLYDFGKTYIHIYVHRFHDIE